MTLHRPQITEQVRPNSVEQPARQPSTGKMARKVDKTPKLCVICGDKAKGINFNALTCMSCKAFFRRNALRNKEMKCPFNDSCQVDKITRKFCSKCRLKKCFDLGMKKEWILSDEEKRLIKEKIMRNRIRRQQQEMESQQPTTLTTPQSGMSGKRRSMESQLKLSGGSVGGKLQSTGKRRATAANKSTNFIHSGKGASFRNRTMTGNGYEANSSATNSSSTSSGNSHLFTSMSTNSSPYTQSSTASFTGNSSSSSSKYPAAAAINAYNIFQEPSAYSLDILLSDNCDAFFESGGNGNSLNSNTVPQNNSALEEWLYNNSNGNTTTNAQGQDKPMTDPKKDDFLQSLSGEIDDPMALNTALNDCCNLLFSNNINSIDLFENENEIDGLTFSGSSSGISDCNESNQSPMYENQSITTGTGLVSDLVEIKKDLLAGENVSTGHITSVTTGSNSTFEYSQVKPENDFTQYLLHDNDPTFNLAIMNPPAPATNNNNRNLLLNPSTTKTVNFQALNSNLNSHANNQIAITQKNFAPSWDNSNALQVVCPRYSSNETYSSKSKVPPLVKMTTNPGTSTTNAESNDFISTCLISTNDQAEDSCNYDPVIEFVPRIGANDVMFREIGFSNRELILPERCLIKELTDACTVLKNPYKRILVFNNYDSVRSCRITEYSFHRLIRMSKRLSRFSQLPLSDQAKMLKFSLLEMLAIRSVLVYNPDRESWGFIDDKCKVNVMVRMDVIRPFCTKCGFQRHKNFPNLFRHEWKNDNIIFDLLTAIVLFTPRPGMCEYEKIKEEHLRYVYLLRRYLEIKYPTIAEAKESFSSLMSHVEEMKHLNADIVFFFQSYSQLLQTSPLFTQLLDLDPSNSAPVPTKPANSNTDTSFGSTSHVFDDPNMFSNLDVNSQLDNMVGAASTGPSSSTSPVSHFGQNTYTGSMDTSTVTSEPGSVAGNASNGSMSFGVGVNNSNSTNSSSNAYRECILNST